MLGYASGVHAPGRRDPGDAVRAAHHLLLGHGLAVRAVRDAVPSAEVGIVLNLTPVTPATTRTADVDAARRIDGLANRMFLDPVLRGSYPADVLADLAAVTDHGHVLDGDLEVIATPTSMLGVNYYTRQTVSGTRAADGGHEPALAHPGSEHVRFVTGGLPVTAMGWAIDPEGLVEVLLRVHREYRHVPLYVTENGAAFEDRVGPDGSVQDPERISYLEAHLRACARATAAGVPLRGYFAWSLLDNFEWAYGYSRRFGLVHVDYPSQRRTPKSSARWYRDTVRRHRAAAPGQAE
jgi:beta-glucosidase